MVERFGAVEIVVVPSTVAEAEAALQADGIVYTSGKELPSLKQVVAAITTGFSEELSTIQTTIAPSEVELEISVSLAAEVKAWVIGAKGEQTFKLKLKWVRTPVKA